MRSEPQDTAQGPCWPRKPEFGGAFGPALSWLPAGLRPLTHI
jgi:hypothetical protein